MGFALLKSGVDKAREQRGAGFKAQAIIIGQPAVGTTRFKQECGQLARDDVGSIAIIPADFLLGRSKCLIKRGQQDCLAIARRCHRKDQILGLNVRQQLTDQGIPWDQIIARHRGCRLASRVIQAGYRAFHIPILSDGDIAP